MNNKWPQDVWQGGVLFSVIATGEAVFLPVGTRRDSVKRGPMRFLGPAKRRPKGYDQTAVLL